MRTSLIQVIIKLNRSVRLKILLFFLISFAIPVSAQITITSSDMSKMFTLGYSTTVHEMDGNAAIDIGNEGGGNSWDFTGLQENLNYDLLSIDKSEAPYTGEFPGADIFTYEKGNTNSGQLELWSYYSLDGSFGNLGSANFSSDQPGDTILIKDNPARIEAKFPMTYNSSWAQTYNQSISYKGMQVGLSSVDWNVVVDGYGMMYLPGGDSSEALRLRQTTTIHTGPIDSTYVTYFFISKYGSQVTLNAVAENPPSEGVINVNGYSWNTPPRNRNGGAIYAGLYVAKPGMDDIVIAGEVDTIKYGGQMGNVDLYYSIDKGKNFELIEADYSSDSGRYFWNVPESLLTRQAVIKIRDAGSSTSLFDGVGYSEIFYIKPWQLTRTDKNGDFELFEPDQDGWAFCNCGSNVWPQTWWQQFDYQNGTDPYTKNNYPNRKAFKNASSSGFPDWPLFVDVFGINTCYFSGIIQAVFTYKFRALRKWSAMQIKWGGSCAGFAVSSLLVFYHNQDITQFNGINKLFSIKLDDVARDVINHYQTHQFGKEAADYRDFSNTPRKLLSKLKEILGRDNKDARPLDYYNKNLSKGHAVVPYKLLRIGNTSKFDLKVYNPNSPGNKNQIIYIDSTSNTWIDSTGFNWGKQSSNIFLERPSAEFLSEPSLNKFISKQILTKKSTVNNELTIYNSSDADISIVSGNGEHIGFRDSLTYNNINNAKPLIPLTANFHPPIGYVVPMDNYDVQLKNSGDSAVYVIFMDENKIYDYSRKNVKANETDKIKFFDGMTVRNPDPSQKIINLETVVDNDSSEKVIQLDNINVFQNDSIHIKNINKSNFLLENFGDETDYNLKLISNSSLGELKFIHTLINLTSNTSHQIIPAWNDIENSKVKILIDNGNDGTIDDSMFISNEITEIKDRYSSNIPTAFTLYQNYPNPFNPVTTIKYDLPTRAHVTLKVYNILGEEVAMLVNGEKQPGSYEVKFDGIRLSSGIYFYSIQTGNKTITKKMILLK